MYSILCYGLWMESKWTHIVCHFSSLCLFFTMHSTHFDCLTSTSRPLLIGLRISAAVYIILQILNQTNDNQFPIQSKLSFYNYNDDDGFCWIFPITNDCNALKIALNAMEQIEKQISNQIGSNDEIQQINYICVQHLKCISMQPFLKFDLMTFQYFFIVVIVYSETSKLNGIERKKHYTTHQISMWTKHGERQCRCRINLNTMMIKTHKYHLHNGPAKSETQRNQSNVNRYRD